MNFSIKKPTVTWNQFTKNLIHSTVLLAVALYSGPSKSCTALATDPGADMIVAKNFDWAYGEGAILFSPAKLTRESVEANNGHKLRWTSSYSSISFHLNRIEQNAELPAVDISQQESFPLGGMNEKGLTIEVVLLKGKTKYPALSASKDSLNQLEIVRYLLDTASSVKEVEDSLAKIQIVNRFESLHYLTCDLVECLVFEFLEGKVVTFQGDKLPYSTLSNVTYQEGLDSLASYQDFGGKRPMAGPNPSGRFAIAASFVSKVTSPSVEKGLALLDKVAVPIPSLLTQWSYVYEPNQLKVSGKDSLKRTFKFDLKTLKNQKKTQLLFKLVDPS